VQRAQSGWFLVIGKQLELRVALRALLDPVHVQHAVDVDK
jgi:hypothetical protein